MNIIAFAGPAGAGKTTCAQYLVQRHGYERMSFATPMYKMLEALGLGWPKTQAEKEANIPWLGVSWRHAATTLGTEWGRQMINKDLWVICALRACNPKGNYVIDDCRFENEATFIRGSGGLIVHITGRKMENTQAANHASEAGIAVQPADYYLDNSDCLEVTQLKLDHIALRASPK
jgi:hypothetical protein